MNKYTPLKHSALAYPKRPAKPHVFRHNGRWVCKSRDFRGQAAKPVTAFRAWTRNKKWKEAGQPMLGKRHGSRSV